MKSFDSIDQLASLPSSTPLGTSRWVPVTQKTIDLFASATGDNQWIHTDQDRASQSEFGRTIAHGFLVLSILPQLVNDVYSVANVRLSLNYGLDKVRFVTPVPSGSNVRGHVEIRSTRRVAQGLRVTLSTMIELEGSERPACVAESIILLIP